MPTRHPIAEESKDVGRIIRVMQFGKKRGRYRVLFTIAGSEVYVLHVRHGSRDRMSKEDLKNLDW